ncbi:MAG: L-serine ammonia-lyase [Saprospiraceae bacterium]
MESISAFEMIKVGIGPSSSHTMGPWRAAEMFIETLTEKNLLVSTVQLKVELFGSLAKTGVGHGTDIAVLLGLDGEDYTKIDTSLVDEKIAHIKAEKKIHLGGQHWIAFDYEEDLIFHFDESLAFHPNGIRFSAWQADESCHREEYFSVGGGFVVQEDHVDAKIQRKVTPYPCHNGETIQRNCETMNLSMSELVFLNEQTWRTKEEINAQCLTIWEEIKSCIWRGTHREGILPGGLNVKRKAAEINRKLLADRPYSNREEWIEAIKSTGTNFTNINKWISCFALAVNEENASFGRIITAPTNGASGVLPAVLMYAYCFGDDFNEKKIVRFIITAGEIGTLFKKNATISAAMGGCQAEIGVSSSMSAAGLTEVMGGSVGQVLMAAEIAMEHHLGMTCDPIGGLVQVPCIERNSMGAIKAITASNIALESDPEAARVSLDEVIKSMWETALDMNSKYKETSEGGLAVNISVGLAEC